MDVWSKYVIFVQDHPVIFMYSLDSIIFIISKKKFLFISHRDLQCMWNMSCGGRHIRFPIDTKISQFVKNHIRIFHTILIFTPQRNFRTIELLGSANQIALLAMVCCYSEFWISTKIINLYNVCLRNILAKCVSFWLCSFREEMLINSTTIEIDLMDFRW